MQAGATRRQHPPLPAMRATQLPGTSRGGAPRLSRCPAILWKVSGVSGLGSGWSSTRTSTFSALGMPIPMPAAVITHVSVRARAGRDVVVAVGLRDALKAEMAACGLCPLGDAPHVYMWGHGWSLFNLYLEWARMPLRLRHAASNMSLMRCRHVSQHETCPAFARAP